MALVFLPFLSFILTFSAQLPPALGVDQIACTFCSSCDNPCQPIKSPPPPPPASPICPPPLTPSTGGGPYYYSPPPRPYYNPPIGGGGGGSYYPGPPPPNPIFPYFPFYPYTPPPPPYGSGPSFYNSDSQKFLGRRPIFPSLFIPISILLLLLLRF